MPLPKDFLHHLHELTVDVSDSVRHEDAAHKSHLIFEAQKKNNSGAVLNAYKEAALKAFKNRIGKTIEKYIQALDIWQLRLDDSIEHDLLLQINLLSSPPSHFDLPPGLNQKPTARAMQTSYAMESSRAAHALRRGAANRLREAKIKARNNNNEEIEGGLKPAMPTLENKSDPSGTGTHPRAFISYSWEDDAHIEWVRSLATRLRQDGIDVSLDRWAALPGDQLPAFMERAIRNNEFVVVVCTPHYKSRSEAREGGVGYEGDIMTGEVMVSRNDRKFIPVLRRGSWAQSAPSWLAGKYHLNLSGDQYSETAYEDLARTLLGIREKAPAIGKQLSTLTTTPKAGSVERQSQISQFDDIKIARIIVEDVSQPRNDGSYGSALYSVPFALTQRPPAEWAELFIHNWNRPPRFTSMHRPGIAQLIGATVTLKGTTIEEVEKYHRDTLKLAVSESNRQYRELRTAQDRRSAEEEASNEAHRAHIASVNSRLSFD